MKIAHAVFGLTPGGAQKLAGDLALSLQQRGHDVDIILIDKFTHCQYEESMIDRLKRGGVQVYSLGKRPGSGYAAVGSIARLAKLIIRRRYNIVHSHLHLSHAFIALATLVGPVRFRHVLTIHSAGERWSRLTSMLARNATVVFCSDAAADKSHLSCRRHVIANGVDYPKDNGQHLDAMQMRHSLGIPPDATILISVGDIRELKNYAEAVKVVSILRNRRAKANFHYLICGAGLEEDQLRQRIGQLSLAERVHLLGPRTDIHDLLNLADCFISMSRLEGLPLSVLEAFFSGIKCALSPIREHRDISGGIAGCILASDTRPESMAASVLQVLDQRESRRELMKLRGPKLEPFSLETCVRSYEELYKSVTNSQK